MFDSNNAGGAFLMEAQERLGRRKSIRHFIVAYNCMKCYLDGEIITKEVSMVDSYDADYLACQMSHGDTDVFFGVSGQKDALLYLASCIAEEEFEEFNEDSYDALCEFANMVNGNFNVFLEQEDTEVEVVPPMCCGNCLITSHGKFCVLKMEVDGKELDLISVIDIVPYMK